MWVGGCVRASRSRLCVGGAGACTAATHGALYMRTAEPHRACRRLDAFQLFPCVLLGNIVCVCVCFLQE